MLTNLFLIFASSWLFAEKVLAPIQVSESLEEIESSRSIEWPVISERPSAAILLPQPEDSLNSLNGLQVRSQGSPTVSIRGSAQSGRSLLLYNHIPLNFASGFGASPLFLPKENLSQVLVIKGPASLFYGSQAMAGAVDWIGRKYNRTEFNINLSDTDESFLPWRQGGLGHQSWHLATPIVNSQNSHLQATAFYEDNDGQYPYQSMNQSGVRGFNASNTSRVTLSGNTQLGNLHLSLDSIVGREIRQSPGGINFPLQTRQETEASLVSISPTYFFNESLSWKSRLSYLRSDSDFLENNRVTFNTLETSVLQNEWVYDRGRDFKLQFFVDGFFHELNSSFVGYQLQQDNLELGPFVSFYSLPQLKHQIGGRYLGQNQKFLPTLSTHYFISSIDLWISYSEGFRNPTLTDLYANTPNSIGNPDLQAEGSKQYEIGLKNQGSFLTWDFRLFHMEYENFIESNEISPSVFTRINQGDGFSRGFDAKLSGGYRAWDWGLDYNYLETQNRPLGRPFRLSPRHQLSLIAGYRWRSWYFQLQNTQWHQFYDISNNQEVRLEDWSQWNSFAHYQLDKHASLSLGLINAFNESKELTLNYPEPQRKYWISYRYQF